MCLLTYWSELREFLECLKVSTTLVSYNLVFQLAYVSYSHEWQSLFQLYGFMHYYLTLNYDSTNNDNSNTDSIVVTLGPR